MQIIKTLYLKDFQVFLYTLYSKEHDCIKIVKLLIIVIYHQYFE
jgi:hypothetical protein